MHPEAGRGGPGGQKTRFPRFDPIIMLLLMIFHVVIVEGFAFVPPRHFFQDLGWPKNCLVFVMGHEADGKLIDVWVGIGWHGFRVRIVFI